MRISRIKNFLSGFNLMPTKRKAVQRSQVKRQVRYSYYIVSSAGKNNSKNEDTENKLIIIIRKECGMEVGDPDRG